MNTNQEYLVDYVQQQMFHHEMFHHRSILHHYLFHLEYLHLKQKKSIFDFIKEDLINLESIHLVQYDE